MLAVRRLKEPAKICGSIAYSVPLIVMVLVLLLLDLAVRAAARSARLSILGSSSLGASKSFSLRRQAL